MTERMEAVCWQLKKPWSERKKSGWRRRYLKKNRISQKNRILWKMAAAVLAAELLYGARTVWENPEAFLHKMGIRMEQETGEKQGWKIENQETTWGIRIHSDGIEFYREENH